MNELLSVATCTVSHCTVHMRLGLVTYLRREDFVFFLIFHDAGFTEGEGRGFMLRSV